MKYKKEDFIMVDWKKIALFAGGTLFGTAGVKIYPVMMRRKYIHSVQQPF